MDGLAFSPDGRTLVSSDGRMHLWRVADGTLTHTLSSELSGVADF
jgi:WD40 repeat protein